MKKELQNLVSWYAHNHTTYIERRLTNVKTVSVKDAVNVLTGAPKDSTVYVDLGDNTTLAMQVIIRLPIKVTREPITMYDSRYNVIKNAHNTLLKYVYRSVLYSYTPSIEYEDINYNNVESNIKIVVDALRNNYALGYTLKNSFVYKPTTVETIRKAIEYNNTWCGAYNLDYIEFAYDKVSSIDNLVDRRNNNGSVYAGGSAIASLYTKDYYYKCTSNKYEACFSSLYESCYSKMYWDAVYDRAYDTFITGVVQAPIPYISPNELNFRDLSPEMYKTLNTLAFNKRTLWVGKQTDTDTPEVREHHRGAGNNTRFSIAEDLKKLIANLEAIVWFKDMGVPMEDGYAICKYCGNPVRNTDPVCPHCLTDNPDYDEELFKFSNPEKYEEYLREQDELDRYGLLNDPVTDEYDEVDD